MKHATLITNPSTADVMRLTEKKTWEEEIDGFKCEIVFLSTAAHRDPKYSDIYPHKGIWNSYIVIFEGQLGADFKRVIPKVRKVDWGNGQMWEYSKLPIDMENGGLTYFEAFRTPRGKITAVKVGNDYNHSWNDSSYLTEETILRDLKKAIEKLKEVFPNYLVRSTWDGKYVPLSERAAYDEKTRDDVEVKGIPLPPPEGTEKCTLEFAREMVKRGSLAGIVTCPVHGHHNPYHMYKTGEGLEEVAEPSSEKGFGAVQKGDDVALTFTYEKERYEDGVTRATATSGNKLTSEAAKKYGLFCTHGNPMSEVCRKCKELLSERSGEVQARVQDEPSSEGDWDKVDLKRAKERVIEIIHSCDTDKVECKRCNSEVGSLLVLGRKQGRKQALMGLEVNSEEYKDLFDTLRAEGAQEAQRRIVEKLKLYKGLLEHGKEHSAECLREKAHEVVVDIDASISAITKGVGGV